MSSLRCLHVSPAQLPHLWLQGKKKKILSLFIQSCPRSENRANPQKWGERKPPSDWGRYIHEAGEEASWLVSQFSKVISGHLKHKNSRGMLRILQRMWQRDLPCRPSSLFPGVLASSLPWGFKKYKVFIHSVSYPRLVWTCENLVPIPFPVCPYYTYRNDMGCDPCHTWVTPDIVL